MLPDYRVRQRDFLLEISRAITAQLDLGEVLRRVLNASVVMLAGQVGLVALRDSNGDYQIRATVGLESAQITPLNQQLRDLVSNAQDAIDRQTLDTRMKAMLASLNRDLRQYVAIPLVFAGEPLGLLIIFRSYHGGASADDIQVLQSFADQAAIAVHNAQLYEHIDHERKRLGAILQHSADGVMILDANLRILMFNYALERMTAWRAQDAIGLPQDDVIVWKRIDMRDLKDAVAEGWPRVLPADSPPEILYVEGDITRRDGLTLSIGITYAPLMTSEHQVANIIANVRDITHWRQAQEMQNIFISTVSHELKTPVAIIKGYAGTLNRTDADWNPDVIHEGLAVIEDEADRLTGLIENLLTASRIQAQQKIQLNLAPVHLPDLAARAVERFSPQTTNHTFTLNFPPDFPTIQGDEVRLRQTLDNLIGNAIKYSPDGGCIEVGGGMDDHTVCVYVRDQGVGLSERDQERIFDRFYRVDGALSRRTQGTGLGLYLAKAIVEAHGGTMRVESKPGQGSTFYFTLPQQ
jgi:PAS domain S-box-containing protein